MPHASPSANSARRDAPPARQVWWFTDGKPGHVSQVRGLVNALHKHGDFELTEFDLRDRAAYRRLREAHRTTARPLILGAGRRTHHPILRAKRATGGFAVILMNPVWPTGHRKGGFDLYVVPEHDGTAAAHDIVLTTGALNPLTAAGAHHPHRGVLLVGGPARRYGWDPDATLARLRAVVDRSRDITHWAATTSRRTPPATATALTTLHPRVDFTPADRTPRGWVAEALADASVAWVTEDSVSMVFEALTAGCRVGLLPMRYRPGLGERLLGWGPGRVAGGVRQLVERGQVTRYEDWAAGAALQPPPEPVAEAQRVAALVWERWESHA